MSSVVTVVVVVLLLLALSRCLSVSLSRVEEQSYFHIIEKDNLLSSSLTRCDVYLSVDISKEYIQTTDTTANVCSAHISSEQKIINYFDDLLSRYRHMFRILLLLIDFLLFNRSFSSHNQ